MLIAPSLQLWSNMRSTNADVDLVSTKSKRPWEDETEITDYNLHQETQSATMVQQKNTDWGGQQQPQHRHKASAHISAASPGVLTINKDKLIK